MAESKDTDSSRKSATNASIPNASIDIEKLTDKVYQLMQAEMRLSIRRGTSSLPGNKRRK
jgi:hypothetical protein